MKDSDAEYVFRDNPLHADCTPPGERLFGPERNMKGGTSCACGKVVVEEAKGQMFICCHFAKQTPCSCGKVAVPYHTKGQPFLCSFMSKK